MDPIDGELRRALAVDPSPEFLARVRTRIEEEPASRSRALSWIVAPAVFAIALVVIVAVWPRSQTQTVSTAPALLTARSIGSTTPVSYFPVGHDSKPSNATLRPRATRVVAGVRGPEVLIAADEAEALRRLILGVREGRIHLSRSLATEPLADDIAIEPITINPIPPLAGDEGARP
jgi:hypothetical protein